MFAVHRTHNPNIPGDLIAHKTENLFHLYVFGMARYLASFAIGFCSKTVVDFYFCEKFLIIEKMNNVQASMWQEWQTSERLKYGGFLRTCAHCRCHTPSPFFLYVSKPLGDVFHIFFSSSEKKRLRYLTTNVAVAQLPSTIEKNPLKNDKIELFPIKRCIFFCLYYFSQIISLHLINPNVFSIWTESKQIEMIQSPNGKRRNTTNLKIYHLNIDRRNERGNCLLMSQTKIV